MFEKHLKAANAHCVERRTFQITPLKTQERISAQHPITLDWVLYRGQSKAACEVKESFEDESFEVK